MSKDRISRDHVLVIAEALLVFEGYTARNKLHDLIRLDLHRYTPDFPYKVVLRIY